MKAGKLIKFLQLLDSEAEVLIEVTDEEGIHQEFMGIKVDWEDWKNWEDPNEFENALFHVLYPVMNEPE